MTWCVQNVQSPNGKGGVAQVRLSDFTEKHICLFVWWCSDKNIAYVPFLYSFIPIILVEMHLKVRVHLYFTKA